MRETTLRGSSDSRRRLSVSSLYWRSISASPSRSYFRLEDLGAISTAGERERARSREAEGEGEGPRLSRGRECSLLRPGDADRVRDRGSCTWSDMAFQGPVVEMAPDLVMCLSAVEV